MFKIFYNAALIVAAIIVVGFGIFALQHIVHFLIHSIYTSW